MKKPFSMKEIINDDVDICHKKLKSPQRVMEVEDSEKTPVKQTNNYYELLRDPRWQKKRLEIMQRDDFTCTSCTCKDKTLNVHHCVPYRKNTKPWEYENEELTTLCEPCHNELSEIIKYGTQIIMGRCWCRSSAYEVKNIMERIDGMNPYQLEAVWKIIDACNKL
jgi:hypothetical protein